MRNILIGKELKDSADILSDWIITRYKDKTLTVGINGPPGCGKTTLASETSANIKKRGRKVITFSIDDFYWTFKKREKEALTKRLLDVRGPGTHDIKLAVKVFESLINSGEKDTTLIPRFNKWLKEGKGDRAPRNKWKLFKGRPDFIIFEGWNVCEDPVDEKELQSPFNNLERECDSNMNSRKYINTRLKNEYSILWKYINYLVFIKVDNMDYIYTHRLQQEKKLREEGKSAMDEPDVKYFVSHYERWINHIKKTLPEKADIVMHIDEKRKIRGIQNE
ncbi:MAG: hypothetical protein ACQESB_06550 [Elusimicrobiota bacterium]